MLDFFPYPLYYGLAILVILLFLFRRKRSTSYRFFFTIFWLYLLFVVSLTLFPIPFLDKLSYRSPVGEILSRVNLVPFDFGRLFENNATVVFELFFGNILLTMPFGFGLPFVARFHPKSMLWIAVAAGFGIESAQLGVNLLLGGTYRSVDINDVLLNAIGAWLGYLLFLGFAGVYRVFSKDHILQGEFFAYLHAICQQSARQENQHPALKES
jgi:glycopeptide antibiotics resistance protein